MSPLLEREALISAGFPRVSGDEPLRYERFHVVIGFSPRERG